MVVCVEEGLLAIVGLIVVVSLVVVVGLVVVGLVVVVVGLVVVAGVVRLIVANKGDNKEYKIMLKTNIR